MPVKIHVNRHVVAANARTGSNDPPLTIIRGRRRERAHTVDLVGPARIVHSPDRPLKCGAKIWIEAQDAIAIDGAAA